MNFTRWSFRLGGRASLRKYLIHYLKNEEKLPNWEARRRQSVHKVTTSKALKWEGVGQRRSMLQGRPDWREQRPAVVRELRTRWRGRLDPDAENLQGRVRCVRLSKFNIMAFKGCKLTDDMIQFSLLKGHCGGKIDDCSCFIAKAEMKQS